MRYVLFAAALLLAAVPATVTAAAALSMPDEPPVAAICVASGYNAAVCSLTNTLCYMQPSAVVCALLQ